jgi:CheY-like chemotaxis protein
MGDFRQRRVLVVDDEAAVRKTVVMVLHLDGHLTEAADSGESALALFKPGKFDLVITDFAMEGMNGAQLAVALKASDPTQPIVMMSAYAEILGTSTGAPLTGVDFLLNKPFLVEELRQVVAMMGRPAAV